MLMLHDILPRAARLFGDRVAVVDGGTRVSYGELAARVDRTVAALMALGVAPGDRVAVMERNTLPFLETVYACVQAGFVLVPINTRLAPAEIALILEKVTAKVLVIAPDFFAAIAQAIAGGIDRAGILVTGGELPPSGVRQYSEAVQQASPQNVVHRPAPSQEAAQIYFTSGTTGTPKGVCLSAHNMLLSAWDSMVALEMGADEHWLHAGPLFHLVGAFAAWALPMLGGRQICHHFSPGAFLEAVEAERVTSTSIPPTFINMLVNLPDANRYNLSSLRLIAYGGSPIMPKDLLAGLTLFGCQMVHSYGVSEGSGLVTQQPPQARLPTTLAEAEAMIHTGHPVPNMRLELRNEAGSALGPGMVGEIVLAGGRVMLGYWNDPQATAEAMRGGWYHTGDLGILDDDMTLRIVGRKKDMIITGGENVYAGEVERALAAHPAVLESAVFGVPDGTWGEQVTAAVVLKEGARADADELVTHCRARIGGYKVPRAIMITSEPLPKSGPGKIAKHLVRTRYLDMQK
jgi:acyl-CoA synthetase (AMP-forming)/AMP-acid ligase II